MIGIFTVTFEYGDIYGEIFPVSALIKLSQNYPIASEPLIGGAPSSFQDSILVYSAGNAFPFKLLYAADH